MSRLEPARRVLRVWVLALMAGALGVAATVGFRALLHGVELLATGHDSGLVAAARAIAPWQRVMVATAGGLLAGMVMHWGARWARNGPAGERNLDYIDAARQGRVDLNDRTTLVRSVASLCSVGTGASIGREGPMVQLSAWFAATLARRVDMTPQERKTVLVCGIAAGIAAAYHAPVAAVVFVLELALGFFVPRVAGPVLVAAACAGALMQWLVEPHWLYVMRPVQVQPATLGAAVVAGLAFGAVAWALLGLLERSRHVFARIAAPVWRLGLGGLLVGLLSAWVPEVWGNGYSVVSAVLQGQLLWQGLALVLMAKVMATALSSGSGAIGGVFTPSLLVGASAGSVLAQLAVLVLPTGWVGDPRGMAVVGMAAVLAGVTHAPLMAIVMVMEMTHQFELLLPAMLATGVAYAVSTGFGVRPLYGNPIEAHN